MNTYSFLHNTASKFPNRIALVDDDGTMSYAQLNSSVCIIAEYLLQLGVKPKNGVGVLGNNSREFVMVTFALMKIGAIIMPVPPNLSESELKELIANSKLNFVCFNEEYISYKKASVPLKIEDVKTDWNLWQNNSIENKNIYCNHVPNAAFVRYTSGTTGKSKGVILSHQSIEERTRIANTVLQLNETDNILWVLSMAFHFVVSITLYIRYGCTIIIHNNFYADSILKSINKFQATFLYASPVHIRLLSQDKSGIQIPTIKTVISTSSGISKTQCDDFYSRFNIPVKQAYGIIEIGLPIINNKSSNSDSIGHAVPGMDVKILDDNGKELPTGEAGNLAIKGPGMFDAYLTPPLSRDEVLQFGYFFTGDLATCNADGSFLIVGRKKSMINVAGNKVFPEEVEFVLLQHNAIESCRVSGIPHPVSGESVVADIVLRKNALQPNTEELYTYCKKYLSAYKVPKNYSFINELPMTKSGKLKR